MKQFLIFLAFFLVIVLGYFFLAPKPSVNDSADNHIAEIVSVPEKTKMSATPKKKKYMPSKPIEPSIKQEMQAETTVKQNEHHDVTEEVSEENKIYGWVLQEGSQRPIEKARVLIYREGRFREIVADVFTAADGSFHFETAFAQDELRLNIEHRHYISLSDLSLSDTQKYFLSSFRIRGQVVNEQLKPIAGALVNNQSLDETIVTNAKGEFETAGGPKVYLVVEKEGYGKLFRVLRLPGEKEPVLVLHPEQNLHGTVLDKQTGEPITGFKIWNMDWLPPFIRAQFDFNGKFTIPVENAGDHFVLEFNAPGYIGKDVEITPEVLATGHITVYLEPATKELKVLVVDEEDRPVPNVTVLLSTNRLIDNFKDLKNDSKRDGIKVSDRNGFVVFHQVDSSEKLIFGVEGDDIAWEINRPMPFPKNGMCTLVVTQAAYLEGDVNLKRYPHAKAVHITQGSRSATIVNESYQLDHLLPGRISVVLLGGEKSMAILDTKDVELKSGEVNRLNFGTDDSYTLEGIVEVEGRPVPYWNVILQQGYQWQTAATDGRGYFKIEGILEGDYQLILPWVKDPKALGQAHLLARYPNQVPVYISKDIEDRFRFRKFGNLRGRIIVDGQYLIEVKGILENGEVFNLNTDLGDDGYFSIPALPPGIYTLGLLDQRNSSNFTVLRDQCNMPGDGRDLDVGTIDLRERGRVVVSLMSKDGGKISCGIKASIYRPTSYVNEALEAFATTERYIINVPETITFDHLPEGPLEISFQANSDQYWVFTPAVLNLDLAPGASPHFQVFASPIFLSKLSLYDNQRIQTAAFADGTSLTYAETFPEITSDSRFALYNEREVMVVGYNSGTVILTDVDLQEYRFRIWRHWSEAVLRPTR